MTTTPHHKIRLSDVRAGDVLLVDIDRAPDPERNTVLRVDGAVGTLCIIDFTNGTSTPPITSDPFVYIAPRPD